jgi:hypothetical protein
MPKALDPQYAVHVTNTPDKWIPVDDVLAVLNNPDWTWARNTCCKYIMLRIDTRDMMCQLQDRDRNVLTLKQLSRQLDSYLEPERKGDHDADECRADGDSTDAGQGSQGHDTTPVRTHRT